MIHERLDIARWIAEHPLAKLNPKTDIYDCGPSASPADRGLHRADSRQAPESWPRSRPGCADRRVHLEVGRQRPTRRDQDRRQRRIGQSARRSWPVTADTGEPFTFVAQFCFADSKDILSALPGDILVIFAYNWAYGFPLLRWFNLGAPLEEPAKLPRPQWEIAPCHAVLHRTVDYRSANYELFDPYPYPLSIDAQYFREAVQDRRFVGTSRRDNQTQTTAI